jgi:prepilin-type N-terminal cleavage/methylation domain-containing protein
LDRVVVMRRRLGSGIRRGDGGFTLTELLVAMVLFGLVLGSAYLALQALSRASDAAIRESTFTRNITYPIDQFQKYAMQSQYPLAYADEYRFSFWIDQHDNNTPDLMTFWTDSSGKFYKRTQAYNASNVAVGAAQTAVLSTDNANIETGQPLFTYYRKDGATLTTTSTIPANADSVRITIVAKYGTSTMESFGTVTFRNRTY